MARAAVVCVSVPGGERSAAGMCVKWMDEQGMDKPLAQGGHQVWSQAPLLPRLVR